MYYFIVNPYSSSSRGIKVWKTVEKQLKTEKIEYQFFYTNHHGHARELAENISTHHAPCTIIAVGGDGTANEVINGLTNYAQIRFGYIPSGSGNDLARGLGLSNDPLTALHTVLHPTTVIPVTIGCTHTMEHQKKFIVSSGIGFDAAVCHEALHSPFKKVLNHLGLGKLTYLGIALKQLCMLRSAPITMILDDRRQFEFDGILFIAAMNLRYEGGGFMFCPDADPCDDYLHLCLIEKMPRLKIIRLLPTAFKGEHIHFDGVHIYRCKKAHIHALAPLPIHTDGEKAGIRSTVTMDLESERLPVIIA